MGAIDHKLTSLGPNACMGPCYDYGGNHLVRDFPIQKSREVITRASCHQS